MKKVKAMVLLFAVAAVLAGAFTVMTSRNVEASKCCWVMVCTVDAPVVCYEVCKPCPRF